MNPPLREAADREALVEGLADGTIDAIATDHAPHHRDDKHVEFDRAPFGIVGLETAASLVLDRLVGTGRITLARMVELMSAGPARLLGVKGGSLVPGAPADVTVLAPDLAVTVRKDGFRSKGRNTPFDGWTLKGGIAATIVGGRTVYVNEHGGGRVGVRPVTGRPGRGSRLKAALDRLYLEYDRAAVVADPVELVRRYREPADREVAGLIASALAFGRVASIMQSVTRVLDCLGPSPAQAVRQFDPVRGRCRLDGSGIGGRAAPTSWRWCGRPAR